MGLLHVFIDASVMPRDLSRPRHDIEQLADLVGAKLTQVHISDISVREWRSQLEMKFEDQVSAVQRALRKLTYHPFADGLRDLEAITQLAKSFEMTSDARNAVKVECNKLMDRLALAKMGIDGLDAWIVFEDYFFGDLPFAAPNSRSDLPNAFILRAAERIVAELDDQPLLAVSFDKRMRTALGKLSRVQVFTNLMELFRSDAAKKAMQHLEQARVWTEKKDIVTEFLEKHPDRVAELIKQNVSDTLKEFEFSGSGIPTDNNKAKVRAVNGVDNLKVGWKFAHAVGPGWLLVPFSFETNADLDMHVLRTDVFSVPDWVEVVIGDFDHHAYYFEARGNRKLKVKGNISFRFTKHQVECESLMFPEVELNDLNVRLRLDLDNEYSSECGRLYSW